MNQITHIFLEGESPTLKEQTKIFRLKAQKQKKHLDKSTQLFFCFSEALKSSFSKSGALI